MKNSLKKLSWLLLLPLTLSTHLLHAQPSGYVVFDFDGITAPLWDLSGPYDIEVPAIGAGGQEITVKYQVNLEHMISGTLRGNGPTLVQIGQEFIAANYAVSGRVSGARGVTKANFTISLKGRGLIAGKERSVSISTSFKMTVADWGGLEGSAYGSLKISGACGAAIKWPEYIIELPAGVDGSWRLVLNYPPFKRFAGVGAVYVNAYTPPAVPPIDAEGVRIFTGRVEGTYSESKDLTSGKLAGNGPSKGVEVEFRFEGFNNWLSGSASLLGQRIHF